MSSITTPFLQFYHGMQTSYTWDELAAMILIGFFSYFGLNLSSYSLRFRNAGNISLISYSQIVISKLLGIAFLGETNDSWSNVGPSLIFFCVGFRFHKNYQDDKKRRGKVWRNFKAIFFFCCDKINIIFGMIIHNFDINENMDFWILQLIIHGLFVNIVNYQRVLTFLALSESPWTRFQLWTHHWMLEK